MNDIQEAIINEKCDQILIAAENLGLQLELVYSDSRA
jgi:hypothetical protein